MHTEAHADVAAGWFGALGSTALSLGGDLAWERASRAVCGVAVFLVAEFRGSFCCLFFFVFGVVAGEEESLCRFDMVFGWVRLD